jgi:hypothetical protein
MKGESGWIQAMRCSLTSKRKQKAESGNLGNEAAGFRLRQGYGGQAGLWARKA